MTTKLHIGLVVLALAVCMGQTAPTVPAAGAGPLRRIDEAAFGNMPDGSAVKLYTLSNAKGMQVRVCTFGATIDGVKVPDNKGSFTNVVACADTFQTLQRFGMQAQTIGRVANRIAGGKFAIDGKDYTVGTGNVLHSGNTATGASPATSPSR